MNIIVTKGLIGREDIHFWNGTSGSDLTFTRPNSKGGTEVLHSVCLGPYTDMQTLAADYTIPFFNSLTTCIIDPNGADRNLTPSADFPSGSMIFIFNKGANAVVFDPLGLNMALGGGGKDYFIKDGTTWR